MLTAPISNKSVLLNIVSTSRRLQTRILESGFKPTISKKSLTPSTNAALDFPYPHRIISRIEGSSAPSHVKPRIIAKVTQWYRDVRAALQSEYAKTLGQLAHLPQEVSGPVVTKLGGVYEALFEQRATKFYADIEHVLRRAAANDRVTAHIEKRKPFFNQECLPLLETYFEYNAYPSAQDRALLARKTTMNPRQIEVWFQNHRTRAKKEGRELRRLFQDTVPLRSNLEPLHKLTPGFLAPKDEFRPHSPRSHCLSSADILTPQHSESPALPTEALRAASPAYAFPAKYGHEPEPASRAPDGKSWSFPPPVWPRQASGKLSARASNAKVTPDELAAQLQKLSISGAGDGKRPRPLRPIPPAWYPIIAIPQTAPHFALIRQNPAQESSPDSHVSHILLPARRLEDRKPSPFSKYDRPAPYAKRHVPRNMTRNRHTRSTPSRSPSSSASPVSYISSSEESELRTPSPSPPSGYTPMSKGASTMHSYRDGNSWLLPT